MDSLRLFSPAKLNPMLKVTKRYNSGYHHLQTLFLFVDMGDHLFFKKADKGLNLEIEGPFARQLEKEQDNIITRSVEWLEATLKESFPISVTLDKKLPIGSGLAGGSGNAATTIAGLLTFFGISLGEGEEDDLIRQSGDLGADVPVCLSHALGRGSCYWLDGSGRYELPQPMTLSDEFMKKSVLLINPLVEISTGKVFNKLSSFSDPILFDGGVSIDFFKEHRNDLTSPASDLCPIIGDILDFFHNFKEIDYAGMSGSGASCFAFCDDEHVDKIYDQLLNLCPGFWVQKTHPILQRPL